MALIGMEQFEREAEINSTIERLEAETVRLTQQIDLLAGHYCRPFIRDDEQGMPVVGSPCGACIDCAKDEGAEQMRRAILRRLEEAQWLGEGAMEEIKNLALPERG